MATFTVSTLQDQAAGTTVLATETADGGGLSLREAIAIANAQAGDDIIKFDASLFPADNDPLNNAQIGLTMGELVLSQNVTINGDVNSDGIADVTIDGSLNGGPTGGARIFLVNSGVTAGFESLMLQGANASGSGGAIYSSGTLNVLNSSFADNTSTSFGGAIYNNSGGAANIVNSTFTGNKGRTGAIDTADTTTIVNSTFSGNHATGGTNGGGGVYVFGGVTTIINSTITGNYANDTGGGVDNHDGTLNIHNSIIAGNKAGTSDDDVTGTINTSNGHNIFGSDVTGNTGADVELGVGNSHTLANVFTEVANTTVGSATFQAGVLADNGGPTRTVLILQSGLAHNSGDLTNIPTEQTLGVDVDRDGTVSTSPVDVDQRGGVRIFEGQVDIGAVERGANSNPVFGPAGDGKVTTDFGGSSSGQSVTVQADGKILVAGFSDNGADNDFALVRYNADGSLDTTFDSDGKVTTDFGASLNVGRSVTVQADGRILVAGFSDDGSGPDFALVRYNADGSLDTTFDSDGKVTTDFGASFNIGQSVTVQADGKILVAGERYNGSNDDFALVRYNADGSLDTTFDSDGKVTTNFGGSSSGQSVTVQADGKILVAGQSYNGLNSDFALVRYNADGSLDTSFDSDGKVTTDFGASVDTGFSVTVQADGKILVAGESSNGSNDDFALVRYNADGSLDTTFDSDGKVTTDFGADFDNGQSVTVQADGKILVAGQSSNGSNDDFALVRYNADGSLDNSFDTITTLGGTVAFTEDGAPVVLDSDVQISDAELNALNGGNGDYSGASLTLARTGGANGEDSFSFDASLAPVTVSGNNLLSGGNAFASFTATGGTLTITFTNANGTIPSKALVANVMQAVAYSNSSDTPPANVAIEWTFNDGQTGAPGGAKTVAGSSNVDITAVNDAPTAVALSNVVSSLAEDASTATRTKIADIAVTDDGTGTNTLDLTGADAASFEIDGSELFLKAGIALDFETKTSFDVAVTVDDTSVGSTPDATSSTHTLAITNVDEASVRSDFNGDSHSDVLWRHDSGLISIWNMTDAGIVPVNIPAPGLDWTIAETGDFDGDGQADLVWRHDSGSMSFWYTNTDGSSFATASPAAPSADWHIQGTGDFNGDGTDDVLWRNESGFMSMWQMTGPGTFNPVTVAAPSEIAWKIQSTGDFNGDGRSDVLWRHDAGFMSIWTMNTDGTYGVLNPTAPGADWHIRETGDFNGDGISDIVWRHDSGSMSIWHMNNDGTYAPVSPPAPGPDWHIQNSGDYNMDGRDDILWRHDSGAIMSIWHMNADGSFANIVPDAPGADWMVQ